MLKDHNDIIRNRYDKADALRAEGHNPFVNRWLPTHSSADVVEHETQLTADGTSLRLAGRVMTIRHMGKASFFHLKDGSGRIQVYIRRDEVPEKDYDLFKRFTDMGDIVGVEGRAFRTKTNELSIHATGFVLLTKSMRPLPEKWHGLTDIETRFRQRYVDLIVNDEVSAVFLARSRVISAIRSYLEALGYLEVETPMMHPVYGGAAARPFRTHHNALDMNLYLRIAPELYLKRLTVGGMEKTFEINRNFRNEGLSAKHNPEFTMLELYTAYWDYRDTMRLTEEMIRHAAQTVFERTEFEHGHHRFDLGQPFKTMTYLEAAVELGIREHHPEAELTLDWNDTPEATLAKLAPWFKPEAGSTATQTHEIITELFEARVEHKLVSPTFITEFPKAASPLAKSKPDDPAVAERFELYLCGMELANGYSELNDPREQFVRFEEQVASGARGNEEAQQMDEDYIRALEYGMPPTSGLGVGIDRLTMVLTNSHSIRDVILFPLMRPE